MLLWLSLFFQGTFLDLLLILLAAVFQLGKLISFLIVMCKLLRLPLGRLGFQLRLVSRAFLTRTTSALRTVSSLWTIAAAVTVISRTAVIPVSRASFSGRAAISGRTFISVRAAVTVVSRSAAVTIISRPAAVTITRTSFSGRTTVAAVSAIPSFVLTGGSRRTITGLRSGFCCRLNCGRGWLFHWLFCRRRCFFRSRHCFFRSRSRFFCSRRCCFLRCRRSRCSLFCRFFHSRRCCSRRFFLLLISLRKILWNDRLAHRRSRPSLQFSIHNRFSHRRFLPRTIARSRRGSCLFLWSGLRLHCSLYSHSWLFVLLAFRLLWGGFYNLRFFIVCCH